jgi:hypothetical protein
MSEENKTMVIIGASGKVEVFERVTGFLEDGTIVNFSYWDSWKNHLSLTFFSVNKTHFTLSCRRDGELIKEKIENLIDGFCHKVHGNEGVRNYLLKLGIKEHE